MQRNFLLFEKQVQQLRPHLNGALIQAVFTFRKNELVFELNGQMFLRISIDVNFPYFLLEKQTHIRQPKYELFKPLEAQSILSIEILHFDKYIRLEVNDFYIDCIFFGKQPNILLLDKEKRLLNSFKEYNPQPLPEANRVYCFREIELHELKFIIDKEPMQKLHFFLKRHFRAFNKTIINEIIFRLNITEDTLLRDISGETTSKMLSVLEDISKELSEKEAFIYKQNKGQSKISPFSQQHLLAQGTFREEKYADLNKAWLRFIQQNIRDEQFKRLLKQAKDALNKRKDYLKRSLQKIEENENLQQRKTLAELKGNLLLTYKTQIKKDKTEVILKNIFSDSLEDIKIKLNPSRSIVENANSYFNKFKNIIRQKETLQIKKNTLLSKLEEIVDLEGALAKAATLNKLQNIIQKLIAMKLIQDNSKKQSPLSLQYSFKRLIFDNEWDIYIGKNGVNNDLLTFAFANKWDIWLHAQGVSGSHVIIHSPHRNFQPPQKVIVQAAQIAALNSKSKHSTTVPVIYTRVSYVHRIRKALPGTVSVRNEKVIFVNPKDF